METTLVAAKNNMEKVIAAFKQELASIRTGKASLAILDTVKVEYYGTLTPLNQLATLKVPEARLITIEPWDKAAIGEIEKALNKASLGLNPTNDGKLIRLAIPTPTEERRKDLVKMAKQHAEDARVAVRLARRDGNEALKKLHDQKEISEDDFKKAQEHAQKLTDEYIAKISQLVEHKEKDILSI